MAIDEESVRWASVPSTLPEDRLPNTSPRSTEFKNTGLQNNQPLPLQWLNGQFKDIYLALKEAQSQIDSIVGGSSQPTLEAIYAVGRPYISWESISPATVLGFGTWVQIEGKFLVGVDSADTDFDTAGETGGTKAHTHTDNLTVDGHVLTTSEMPSHTHDLDSIRSNANGGSFIEDADSSGTAQSATTTATGGGTSHTHGLSGGVQSTSNLPPYEALFIWKRTA